jgi:probable phosphoglycerate mutase
MEILLIRHGLPLRVESDRPVDPPLAPQGHAQADALARWLEDEPPDHLIASTMGRAVDTAQHLADAFGLELDQDEDFCEFDRGTHVYIPLEELKPDHPHMVRLIEDWFGPESADRRAAFQARVVAALDRHLRDLDAERVALVSHGGVINATLAHVLGIDHEMFFRPEYTSVSRITWNGKRFRMVSINEAGHLRGL